MYTSESATFFSRHLRNLGLVGEDGSYFKIGVGLAVFAMGGFWLLRYLRQQHT
jgi:hypothetical protein